MDIRLGRRPAEARLLLRLADVRAKTFWTIVLLLSWARATPGQTATPVAIAVSEGCPVRIESVHLEASSAAGTRVRFVVHNPQRRTIQRLIVTAATVDSDHRVTAIRVQLIEEPIAGRGKSEQIALFTNLFPEKGERVVFGVQAVGWDGDREWRGIVRLASATTLNAAKN
jgi:hypothetical protein